jgi:Fis family transcriptional regulator
MTTPFNKQQHTNDVGEVSFNGTQNSLSECVEQALKDYFEQLDGHPAANLYDMLLAEVEAPLIKATLEHTHGNQSRTAEILGINRGTLRKKRKLYGL